MKTSLCGVLILMINVCLLARKSSLFYRATTKDAANWIKRKAVDPSQQHKFCFDNVYGSNVSTPEIYHVIARPITKAAMHGYNGTVFMYG